MANFNYNPDRVADSTDNNEYADGDRDENLWEEDIVDTDIATDDAIINGEEDKGEGERPEYSEAGFRKDIGK